MEFKIGACLAKENLLSQEFTIWAFFVLPEINETSKFFFSFWIGPFLQQVAFNVIIDIIFFLLKPDLNIWIYDTLTTVWRKIGIEWAHSGHSVEPPKDHLNTYYVCVWLCFLLHLYDKIPGLIVIYLWTLTRC